MKARVVLVTDSPDPSGLGEHMLTLGTALAAEFDVLLAAPDGSGALLARAAAGGLRVKSIDVGASGAFTRWLRAYRADLVHVHAGIGWEGHDLVRAASGAAVPVIRTEHLPYLLTNVVQQAAYRAMLLSVTCRIAVSKAVAETHAVQGGGPIHVVQNGIAPRQATRDRAAVRAELGLEDRHRLVLTVARFTAQKAYDVLLAAVPAVLEAAPDARFVLVGDGRERGAIAAMIAEAGLMERVLLLGQRDDVADLLAAADLFVLPSHFEGLSLALLEAAAAGLPIVATATGGTVEGLGADHAFLVRPGDAEALAAAVIRALTDTAEAGAAAEQALNRFQSRFTTERMAAQTADIYRSILTVPNRRGAAA